MRIRIDPLPCAYAFCLHVYNIKFTVWLGNADERSIPDLAHTHLAYMSTLLNLRYDSVKRIRDRSLTSRMGIFPICLQYQSEMDWFSFITCSLLHEYQQLPKAFDRGLTLSMLIGREWVLRQNWWVKAWPVNLLVWRDDSTVEGSHLQQRQTIKNQSRFWINWLIDVSWFSYLR